MTKAELLEENEELLNLLAEIEETADLPESLHDQISEVLGEDEEST